MQQFTVPQFIDVESKIIGPITTRQFLILLISALLIGLSFRFFDTGLFIVVTLIIAVIAALFSFVKINGRPFHYFILNSVQTMTKSSLRVWNHHALINDNPIENKVPVKVEHQKIVKEYYKKSRLAEVALIVDTKGKYKGE